MKISKVLFLLLLVFYPVNLSSQGIDIRLLRLFNNSLTLPHDKVLQFVSNTSIYVNVGVPAGMAVAGLIKHDDKLLKNALVMSAASLISGGITVSLKYSVNRVRPFITYPDIFKNSVGGSPSFPSGHTSSAFATATMLSLEYPKWYVIVPSFTWASTVAYSRLNLGVHYPSDVIVGAIIGAGSAWATYAVNKKLISNYKKKHVNVSRNRGS